MESLPCEPAREPHHGAAPDRALRHGGRGDRRRKDSTHKVLPGGVERATGDR